jgi:hypothetical protein
VSKGALIPVLLATLCYWSSINFNFSGDDFVQIVQNPLVTTHSFLAILKTATYPGDLYRPLTTISFAAEHMLWGNSPLGYHIVNLLLYISALLLIARLYGNGAAAIFSIMPIHIEGVVPVYAGRCELLAANFVLLGILAARHNHHLLPGLALICGLFSKESAAAGPLLIALDCLYNKQSIKAAIFPLGLIALAFSIRTELIPPLPTDPIDNPLITLTNTSRIQVATSLLGTYAINSVLPCAIGYDYSVGNTPTSILAPWNLVNFIFALLLLAVGLRKTVRDGVGFGILWFFAAFSITSNFIPIGAAYGDRLAFLPSLGIAVVLQQVFMHLRAYKVVTPIYCLVCALITIKIIPSFRDDYALTARRAELSPNARVLTNLAVMQRNNSEFESAIITAQNAIKIYPAYDQAYYVIGSTQMLLGDYSAGLESYKQALVLAPSQEQSLNGLGRYYLNIGEQSIAADYFEKLLKVNPTSFDARLGLTVIEARSNPEAARNKLLLLQAERPSQEIESIIEALSQ